MHTPKIAPKIAAMPGFEIMKHYDAWEMLASIFGHYHLDRLRKELWDIYKAALLHKGSGQKKVQRKYLTLLYDNVNDLATAAYFIVEEKDLKLYYDVDPAAAFFPKWQRFESDPWKVLVKIFSDYNLDELRGGFWRMYQSAMLNTGIYPSREDRSSLIFLFERLNDLATAVYVIVDEKFRQQQLKKTKKRTRKYKR